MADVTPPFRFTVEVRGGYVFVGQRGRAERSDEIEAMQREIDAALASHGLELLMFDNRETEVPDPWISSLMWTWLSSNSTIYRVAMLNSTVSVKKRVQRSGERNRIIVAVFDNEAEAAIWLSGG